MFFFFKQKTAYEMRISDWSSDVCSSDLSLATGGLKLPGPPVRPAEAEPRRCPDSWRDETSFMSSKANSRRKGAFRGALVRICNKRGRSRNTICCIASSATYCFNGYEMRAAAPCSAAHRSRELGRVEPCVTPFEAPVHMRRSEEHTSELQSLMRISYAVFCLKKQK